MESPRVLITGDAGFIGRHLKDLIPDSDGCDLIDGVDICDLKPSDKYTNIFHLAAFKSVPAGELRPERFIKNNCFGTLNVIKAFPNARIINVSSSAANECKSVYGMTKYFGEMVGDIHKNCLNVRLYNVFGEGQSIASGAVVPRFIDAFLNNTKPIIYGDGRQSRDFTYVLDVVHELNRLMFATKDTGLTHLGYSNSMRIIDLCREICGDTEIDFQPKRSFDIEYSCAMNPMQITYGRQIGLRNTIQWWKELNASSAT